ncbi:MAG: hypothetical protein ACMG6E_05630, partial [Candidatus Roizmanbacteria bacterium]
EGPADAAHLGEAAAARLLVHGGLDDGGVEVVVAPVAVVGAALGLDERLLGGVHVGGLQVVEGVGVVDVVLGQLLVRLVLAREHDGGLVHVLEDLAVLGRLSHHPLLLLLIVGAQPALRFVILYLDLAFEDPAVGDCQRPGGG